MFRIVQRQQQQWTNSAQWNGFFVSVSLLLCCVFVFRTLTIRPSLTERKNDNNMKCFIAYVAQNYSWNDFFSLSLLPLRPRERVALVFSKNNFFLVLLTLRRVYIKKKISTHDEMKRSERTRERMREDDKTKTKRKKKNVFSGVSCFLTATTNLFHQSSMTD